MKGWAVGTLRPTGYFAIRRIFFGRLLARYEKRDGEKIVKVTITEAK